VAEARQRIEDVEYPFGQTYGWVFGPSIKFTTWLQDSAAPYFWIQGKPGSGKSTMMKYILRQHREECLGAPTVLSAFWKEVPKHVRAHQRCVSLPNTCADTGLSFLRGGWFCPLIPNSIAAAVAAEAGWEMNTCISADARFPHMAK